MKIVQCSFEQHGAAILSIFNEAILNSTALYEYKARTIEVMSTWFENKAKATFPVIGIENESGEFMGFGSYGTFRAFPAFKYSVEHSVYVDQRFRGRGVGKRLLQEMIAAAQLQDYHMLIGVIDSSNAVSIRLHETLGFTRCASIRECGFKFGRWLDVAFYQLLLATPPHPVDG